jgi:acetylornithine deacetylase/succinyl-diaminopimelate desuccinylase-like protein
VLEILEDIKKRDPEFRYELVDSAEVPVRIPLPKKGPDRATLNPTEIPVEEPVVQSMLHASEDALGKRLPVKGTRYACDTPYYVNEGGIPALAFGPGCIDQAHTYDEYVEIRQLIDAAKVYALGAMRYLGYAK